MTARAEGDFVGAKLAIFIGARLLIYLRDDFEHIPFPAHWDFAGGAREGQESAEACALRETHEEFGLTIAPTLICHRRYHCQSDGGRPAWFFVAHLPDAAQQDIRFGDEGQYWRLVVPEDYGAMTGAIPHLADLLGDYLALRASDQGRRGSAPS